MGFKSFYLLIFFIPLLSVATAQQPLSEKLEWYAAHLSDNPNKSIDDFVASITDRLREAQQIGDFEEEARLNKEIGLYHLTQAYNYSGALDAFIECLKIEDHNNLEADQIITYIAMARVFEVVGDHLKSADLINKAMQLSEPFDDSSVLIYLSNKLGKLNALNGRYNEALENYALVLEKNDSVASPLAKAEALFNKAHVHTRKNEYKEALSHHKKALALWRKNKQRMHEARSLNDIGELYRLMKNNDQALRNFVAALRIRTELNDIEGLANSYINAGILYFNQRNFERSIANLELGLEAANSAQSGDLRAKANEYLSQCYKETGNFEKAFEHTHAFMELVDFLRREKTDTELVEAENRYELDKKELEIRRLEIEQEERDQKLAMQRKLQNFLFTIIGFGVIIISLIFFLYLTKRRATISLAAAHARVAQQNVQLQQLNATKDKFFSILSHDLKGPLNSFTSFARMLIDHTNHLSKEEIQMLAREIDKNLKNLFALLENLLEWSRSQTGNIEFEPEPFDLHDVLQQNQDLLQPQAGNKGVTIVYTNTKSVPLLAHRHSINTVIRNLISNAIKFTPTSGTITLSVKPDGDAVMVVVADTGVGMSAQTVKKLFRIDTKYSTNGTANEKGTGLGLILCKDFVEKNGGRIGVHSEEGKGSVFYFTVPVRDQVKLANRPDLVAADPH